MHMTGGRAKASRRTTTTYTGQDIFASSSWSESFHGKQFALQEQYATRKQQQVNLRTSRCSPTEDVQLDVTG
eukprot:764340-Hanusia_phi.AAC.2